MSLKHKWKDTFNSFCNLWANTGSRGIENFVRKYQVVHDLVHSCVSDLYSLGMWFRRQIFRISLGCVSSSSKMNILAGPKLSQAAHGSPSPETVVSSNPLRWWCIGKESPASAGEAGSIPESGRSLREGNGNPLRYSCLGNPMDRGAWRAIESTGLQRVGHDLVTEHICTRAHTRTHARTHTPIKSLQLGGVVNKHRIQSKRDLVSNSTSLCLYFLISLSIKLGMNMLGGLNKEMR